MDLSLNLKAVVAQQLLPTVDGQGRRAAIEVLVNTPRVADLIRAGEVHELKELMRKSGEAGMQTFDQALFKLYQNRHINYDVALSHADSPNDLRLMIKLEGDLPVDEMDNGANTLTLEEDESDSNNGAISF